MRFVFSILCTILLSSCTSPIDIDLGEPALEMTSWPRIIDITFLGQSKICPQVLLFELTFDDADGDVGEGFVDVHLGADLSRTSEIPLRSLLLQAGISPKSQQGRFVLPLQIYFENHETGRNRFEIGFKLRDRVGLQSNFARVRLTADF